MVAEVCAPANGASQLLPKQPILPTAVYARDEAVAITGFSQSTIIRAEEKGRLTGRYEGRRRFYLGRDLLRWLANSNCEVCGDPLSDSSDSVSTDTGVKCATCANYRQ